MTEIHLSAILPALADHVGVDLADVLAPLRDAFWADRGQPRNFRSDKDPPSMAGSMKAASKRIAFPDALPYVAGVACGDNIRLTGIEIAPGVLWYGDFHEAKIVLKDTVLPMTLITGLAGRRLADVVAHPALARLNDLVIALNVSNGHVTIRTTCAQIPVVDPLDRPTPRARWMVEAQEERKRADAR